jgi:hypothetical protein
MGKDGILCKLNEGICGRMTAIRKLAKMGKINAQFHSVHFVGRLPDLFNLYLLV